ncbi:MAG: tetratricopeptide repeat protein [Vulcanimicrobiota bacterium]
MNKSIIDFSEEMVDKTLEISVITWQLLESLKTVAVTDEIVEFKKELIDIYRDLLNESVFMSRLAESYLKKKQYDKAMEVFENMGEESPLMALKKGDMFLNLGQYGKAKTFYNMYLENNEEKPMAWFKKANLYYVMGKDLENSVFYLERALELEPEYLDALLLMSKVWVERATKKDDKYIKRRMNQEAMKCLEKAENLNDDLSSPERELNMAKISALFSKIYPEREDEFFQRVAAYFQEALEKDEKVVEDIQELIKTDRIFTELDIQMSIEESKERPGTMELDYKKVEPFLKESRMRKEGSSRELEENANETSEPASSPEMTMNEPEPESVEENSLDMTEETEETPEEEPTEEETGELEAVIGDDASDLYAAQIDLTAEVKEDESHPPRTYTPEEVEKGVNNLYEEAPREGKTRMPPPGDLYGGE